MIAGLDGILASHDGILAGILAEILALIKLCRSGKSLRVPI